ncbi:MAG: hypothetical protein AABX01_04120 [Candidatus Micrarchaeota archaeon]
MRAVFDIEFKDQKEAENSLRIILPQKSKNAVLHVLHKKGSSNVQYIIEAPSFSPLRARSTSLLRDIKIMLTVFERARFGKPKS